MHEVVIIITILSTCIPCHVGFCWDIVMIPAQKSNIINQSINQSILPQISTKTKLSIIYIYTYTLFAEWVQLPWQWLENDEQESHG